MGYLDDISLVGSLDTVASDVAQIINVGTEIGLLLNVDKCELIAHDDVVVNDAVLQSFNRVKICLLYTSPSPRDRTRSRMPSSA